MNISTIKAQGTGDAQETPSNRLKIPFNEQQAQNKEKIIIITLQGTILNEDQEIPNTSVFLNIMKKETNIKIIYISEIEAKQMKEIKKLFRAFAYPSGEILLKNKQMDIDQHFTFHLQRLREKYDIQLLITSNEKVTFYSQKYEIPIINIEENTEWDHAKRKEIFRFLQNPCSATF